MSIRTGVIFSGPFSITPEQLAKAEKKLPINSDGYIPRAMVLDGSFSHVLPTFAAPEVSRLGRGAITMSFDITPFGTTSFGFMWPPESGRLIYKSQRTNGIELAPNPANTSSWLAVLDTPERLRPEDEELFDNGIGFYATYAAGALLDKR